MALTANGLLRRPSDGAPPSPRVVIGSAMLNKAPWLPEALDSLLAQTCRDFVVVLIDDGSTDNTEELVREYAARDPRIVYYHKNEARQGMIRNWRRVFEVGFELYPEAEYFAWGSDHDVWDPRWLETLVGELDRHPEVVVAYPLNVRIDENGKTIRGAFRFDTFGVTQPLERLRRAAWGMSAGNMIYGLFRAKALERVGICRPVLLPDRMILSEISLYGQFKQVREILWYRRFAGIFSLARQRGFYYPEGNPPYSYLPWWLIHTGSLVWQLGIRGTCRPEYGRGFGLLYALASLPLGAAVELRSQSRKRVIRPVASALHPYRRTLKRLARRDRPRRMLKRLAKTRQPRKILARLAKLGDRAEARAGRR